MRHRLVVGCREEEGRGVRGMEGGREVGTVKGASAILTTVYIIYCFRDFECVR